MKAATTQSLLDAKNTGGSSVTLEPFGAVTLGRHLRRGEPFLGAPLRLHEYRKVNRQLCGECLFCFPEGRERLVLCPFSGGPARVRGQSPLRTRVR